MNLSPAPLTLLLRARLLRTELALLGLLAAGTLTSMLTAVAAAQPPASKDAAIGVFPFLVGNMDAQIPTVVATAQSRGLETIYVSVYRTDGPRTGTLWVTDSAGRWSAAWGPVRPGGKGIDLRALITAAHAKDIQVVGVLKCFADNVQPTDAAHRAFLLDVVDYFASSYDAQGRPYYDLDGLALDYVRYVSSSGTKDPTLVTGFVRDVKRRCAPLSVHAYLLAGRYDFDGPTYDGSFKSYTSVLNANAQGYGQHWEQLAQHLDVMMPMAYTADGSIYATHALHQAYVRQVAAYCRVAVQRSGSLATRVHVTIRTYTDGNETCTAQTIDASISGALLGSADGYQAFRYGTMQGHNDWWQVMQQYAEPGQQKPIPVLAAPLTGLSAGLDARASRDPGQSSAALQVRFDVDGDGTFDTAWLPNTVAHDQLLRGAGAWRIGLEVKDGDGLTGATTRRVVPAPILTLDRAQLNATTGGAVKLTLVAGPAAVNHTYLVTASFSGTAPGVPLGGGVHLPLNLDGLSFALIQLVNGPILQQGLGQLDASGAGVATFAVPPGLLAPLAPRQMHWAALAVDGLGRFVCTSEPQALSLVR